MAVQADFDAAVSSIEPCLVAGIGGDIKVADPVSGDSIGRDAVEFCPATQVKIYVGTVFTVHGFIGDVGVEVIGIKTLPRYVIVGIENLAPRGVILRVSGKRLVGFADLHRCRRWCLRWCLRQCLRRGGDRGAFAEEVEQKQQGDHPAQAAEIARLLPQGAQVVTAHDLLPFIRVLTSRCPLLPVLRQASRISAICCALRRRLFSMLVRVTAISGTVVW